MSRRFGFLFASLAFLSILGLATAQQPGGGTDDVKKQLGASDEEWKVIGPKVQKVIAARQAMASDIRGPGGFFGGGRFGGGPGGFGRSSFDGPGGGFGGPGGSFRAFDVVQQPGQVLPTALRDAAQLTPAQKKEMEELQKEVDDQLAKILTDEQKKQLKAMQATTGPTATPTGPGGLRPGPGTGTAPLVGSEPAPTSAITQAQAELKTTLNDPKHTTEDVAEKVAAVRKARQKARDDLDKAQKELVKMLTADQQAVLVSLGYLE
jgi:Spy/CpxP family protein refolding chaperone